MALITVGLVVAAVAVVVVLLARRNGTDQDDWTAENKGAHRW